MMAADRRRRRRIDWTCRSIRSRIRPSSSPRPTVESVGKLGGKKALPVSINVADPGGISTAAWSVGQMPDLLKRLAW